MEFFRKTTTIDFMELQKWAALFSSLVFIFSVVTLCVNGLNLGLDFTGGSQIVLRFKDPANLGQIRKQLSQHGFPEAVAQNYGASTDVLITIPPHKDLKAKSLGDDIIKFLPGSRVMRTNFVGPKVGKELTTMGLIAIIISMIGTMIYIMMRFELRFAISSTVALIHDPILILGIFSLFHLSFDLVSLGAVLAILGYSLNDTVVVFDRVRENFRKLRKGTPREIMNLSVNQTLSRTIMTSGLTLLSVIALYVYGGETLRGFSLAWIIGIVIGTYSSIYVAGSLAVVIGLNRKDFLPSVKKEVDSRP